jgi:1-acyl-sn-glycerol-3-phosphate acyltransferase
VEIRVSFVKNLGKNALNLVDDAGYALLKILEPFSLTRHYQEAMYTFSSNTVDAYSKVANPYKAIDLDTYIPKEGAAIVASNHNSEWDVIILATAIEQAIHRPLHQMAKHSLFKIPVVNAWVRTHFAFPLRRGETDRDAVNYALNLLNQGELVGMYPEGTTNDGNGELLDAHVGLMRLAIQADVPIIPVGITGTENIYPKHAKMLNFGQGCVIKAGPAFEDHREYAHKGKLPEYDVLKQLTDSFMGDVKELLYYNKPI